MDFRSDVLKPNSLFRRYVCGLHDVVVEAPFTKKKKSTTKKELDTLVMVEQFSTIITFHDLLHQIGPLDSFTPARCSSRATPFSTK